MSINITLDVSIIHCDGSQTKSSLSFDNYDDFNTKACTLLESTSISYTMITKGTHKGSIIYHSINSHVTTPNDHVNNNYFKEPFGLTGDVILMSYRQNKLISVMYDDEEDLRDIDDELSDDDEQDAIDKHDAETLSNLNKSIEKLEKDSIDLFSPTN